MPIHFVISVSESELTSAAMSGFKVRNPCWWCLLVRICLLLDTVSISRIEIGMEKNDKLRQNFVWDRDGDKLQNYWNWFETNPETWIEIGPQGVQKTFTSIRCKISSMCYEIRTDAGNVLTVNPSRMDLNGSRMKIEIFRI